MFGYKKVKAQAKMIKTVKSALTLIVVGFGFLSSASQAAQRFPIVNSVFDTEEIVEKYEVYLSFVTNIGKEVDRNSTQKLLKLYGQLKRRSPEQAAQFLKGLRFEMISKVDLMGVSNSALSTHTPELRKWVGRYLKEWVREADEHLFRTFTNQSLARK